MTAARVALIGLGRMASTIDDEVVGYPAIVLPYSIAGACAASDRLELVAGCDLLAEKRTAFTHRWGVRAVYDDYATMLRQEAPDLVAICTRGENHAELAVATAELGVKGIYCEKAIACSFAENDRVLAAVGDRGIAFATGVLRRYDVRQTQLREYIVGGGIGRPQAALHYGATSLLHGHTHSIDTLLYLLGDPRVARIRGELRPRDLEVGERLDQDPGAVYQFETDTGVSCSTVAAGDWEFEVIGTEGVVRVTCNNAGRSVRRREQLTEKWTTLVAVELPEPAPASATVVLMEDLAAAAMDGAPQREGVAHAHHVTEACLAVAESHRRGGAWLELPVRVPDLYVHHI